MVRGNQAVIGSENCLAFEDSSGSLVLHNGDHPGLILVSHPLSGGNYNMEPSNVHGAYSQK